MAINITIGNDEDENIGKSHVSGAEQDMGNYYKAPSKMPNFKQAAKDFGSRVVRGAKRIGDNAKRGFDKAITTPARMKVGNKAAADALKEIRGMKKK